MANDYSVAGRNPKALFTLRIHRGDGMCLLGMNWKNGEPPDDFVGFAIEYREPDGAGFLPVRNRIQFPDANGNAAKGSRSSREAPIQMFRWVHFPGGAEKKGKFTYRVTPVMMDAADRLIFGEPQEASLELARETHPQLNVTFTRGFVSSQAFVDQYESVGGGVAALLPRRAADGPDFVPTHPKADEALRWMGFEARSCIYELLDEAIADPAARVSVIAYDLSEAGFIRKLESLGARLRVIVDDSGEHAEHDSGETTAAARLVASAGAANVKRQHMKNLQHNKVIIVESPTLRKAVGGSTNFSWRGFYVQANNAVIVTGDAPVAAFKAAFETYWNDADDFGASDSAAWTDLGIPGLDARVSFSPHDEANSLLASIADDIERNAKSSLFYSLAFLYQTPGVIKAAIESASNRDGIFAYGTSDKPVGGLMLYKPDGNPAPVSPAALAGRLPEPFSAEPTGGGGNRMHHKFVVIDFNKPTARVYLGSYNFSNPADRKNGENLFLIRDRKVAVSYAVEAVRLFDHYSYRVKAKASTARKPVTLRRPPRAPGETPWWKRFYTDAVKIRDRKLFS